MTDRPVAARRRQREFAAMADDFEEPLLHNTVHDTILEDEQLAWLCEATATVSIASDLRERSVGEDGEYVKDLAEMWGELDHIARQRALEVVAEACATTIRDDEQWIEDSPWEHEEIHDAQKEVREWMRAHTNETNRASVEGVLSE